MTYRKHNLLGLFACLCAMGFALYLQYGQGLEPCPLCVFQRMAMIALGVFFLLAALHAPIGRWAQHMYGVLQMLAAGLGISVAGRHVWLQHLPADQVPACGPGYDYVMQNFPLADAFAIIFRGSGECAKVNWTLFGLSLPMWTLIGFVGLAGYVVLVWRQGRR